MNLTGPNANDGESLRPGSALLLAVHEQAERMAGGVEHHSQPRLIAVRRLEGCLGAAGTTDALYRGANIVDEYLEVHHLCLLSRFLWPCRRLICIVRLEVETDAAGWVPDLDPAGAVATVDLPAEQVRVERRQRFGIGAVECDPRPRDRRRC